MLTPAHCLLALARQLESSQGRAAGARLADEGHQILRDVLRLLSKAVDEEPANRTSFVVMAYRLQQPTFAFQQVRY